MLITYRDLVFVAILPEGRGREPLLDEGLAAVHDGATWDQITDCFLLTGVVEPARFCLALVFFTSTSCNKFLTTPSLLGKIPLYLSI